MGELTRDFLVDEQRWPTDKAYYIAKELLMTERTYKKDLDVINVVRISRIRCYQPMKHKISIRDIKAVFPNHFLAHLSICKILMPPTPVTDNS